MGKKIVNNSVAVADGVQSDGAAKTVTATASDWAGGTVTIAISSDLGVKKVPIKKGADPLTFTLDDNDMIDAVKIGLRYYAIITGSPVGLEVEIF